MRRVVGLIAAAVIGLGTGSVAGQSTERPSRPTGLKILPPGATTPAPPSSLSRFYDPNSPWNTLIASNAAIDPRSTAMAQAVASAAQAGGLLIAVKKWSWPVYYADAGTPRHVVSLTASWAPARSIAGVPIPANASPDPSDDGHLAIIDISTNCEYDFYQAVKQTSGNWTAGWANATRSDGTGWYSGGYSATGSGAAGAAGLIRPEELQAGVIPHALAFAFPLTMGGGPVSPATESDGRSAAAEAIPEGARLQLDPALDLSTLGLKPYELVIGRALQQYGMFLMDSNTGGVTFAAQNPQSSTLGYPWGDQTYVYLPLSLVSRLRVLSLPPQHAPTGYVTGEGCATFR